MTSELFWWLINLQIAFGAFDVLYHHEMTERLPWRHTAASELKLHAARNWLYTVLFMALGWTWPTGALAMVSVVILAVEIVITLWDFVEEDRSRKLPGTERVLHTLLAINYGAILVLLVPQLMEAATLSTALVPAWHGPQSIVVTLAAVAVLLFGLRDWQMSKRVESFVRTPAANLVAALPPRQRVLVTGATGLIGARLVEALAEAGHEVTAHVRSAQAGTKLALPVRLVGSLDEIPNTARIDAIVNLAGAPVAEAPWTLRNRLRILRSRLRTTRKIVRLLARLEVRPGVLISSSAIGFYGNRDEETLDETSAAGAGFPSRLCVAWEAEARRAESLGVRVVLLRTGVVLDRDGGMLARLLPAFDLCLGGRIGSGAQWLSWITRDDLVRLIAFALVREEVSGPVNACAPKAVRNGDFTRVLARMLRRPAILPLPTMPLRICLGEMGEEMLLGSTRVMPARALAAGFVFSHPELVDALAVSIGLPGDAQCTGARCTEPHGLPRLTSDGIVANNPSRMR